MQFLPDIYVPCDVCHGSRYNRETLQVRFKGLTIAEAMHPLTLMVVGVFGRELPNQNGAPIRLVVPWKYGFKSIKSIVRITFTDSQPETFWNTINDELYGFWANVNPDVPFPDWSQATEKPLGGSKKIPTLLYNGYEEFVADLYKDLQDQPLFM